jgi:DNA-binding NtrC family response regulator
VFITGTPGRWPMKAVSFEGQNRQHSLLLVGDHPTGTMLVVDRAAKAGWRTVVCKDLRQARAMLDANSNREITAIIVDECAETEDLCEVIADLRSRLPRVPILLITENSSAQRPLYALRAGASDFLRKPVEPERLLHALRAATSRTWAHHHELESFAEKFVGEAEFPSIIGADPDFRQALAQAAVSARGHGNILLEGESGTGRDTLARAIHSASPRARAPLKVLNVRAASEASLESALFGHLRGAFVGAFEARQGLLQECDGATLLVDEVNRLPATIQERLAEALIDRRVRPIGAEHSFCSDVRVIAMSNQRLDDLVSRGDFNRDLHQVLSSTLVHLPPLRERAGDIPLIARHFLATFRNSSDLHSPVLSEDALSLLCRFNWPGNVRQLQTVLFRAAAFSNAPALTVEDFAHMAGIVNRAAAPNARVNTHASGIALYAEDGHLRPLADIECDILRLAIGHYRGRMSEVARRLGIGRSTLYRRLAELGIENS